MKKSSMIFKVICLAVCFALFIAVVPTFAEDVIEDEAVVETDEELVTEVEEEEEVPAEDETLVEEDVPAEVETDVIEEVPSDVVDEEEPTEEASEEDFEEATDVVEDEVVDLFTATLRDGGVYVTPGMLNAAVFTHDGLRYKVAPATGNAIRLDGFESGVKIETEKLSEKDKNRLYANAEITTQAAHSGYFGLSVYPGDFVYRVGVTEGAIYVFSAWVKMPNNADFGDMGRAFTVTSEATGIEYVVGWNEIGRDIDNKKSWQQVIFTFKAPESGLFAIEFDYSGDTLFIDDIELYEAEIFDNPLEIKQIIATDANGEVYIDTNSEERLPGSFSTSGKLTHKTIFYNSDEDDVYFTGVMALYKNDILIDVQIVEECALVLDEAELNFEIEIPEDDDLSQYKYLVYFVNGDAPTQFYGHVPSRTNPYVVKGN